MNFKPEKPEYTNDASSVSDKGDSAKIKIAHVLPTVFEPIKTFGHFCQFSTNKESLSENQSYILVTVIMYRKIRE